MDLRNTAERMEDLSLLGIVLGLIGGLLAFVPALERLLAGGPVWESAVVTMILSGVALFGVWLGLRERAFEGGLLAFALGIVIAVVGPTTPGILLLIGGALLFLEGRLPLPEQGPDQATAGQAEPTTSSDQA